MHDISLKGYLLQETKLIAAMASFHLYHGTNCKVNFIYGIFAEGCRCSSKATGRYAPFWVEKPDTRVLTVMRPAMGSGLARFSIGKGCSQLDFRGCTAVPLFLEERLLYLSSLFSAWWGELPPNTHGWKAFILLFEPGFTVILILRYSF